MIYFDNAATGGKKPDNVLNAVASAIKVCANPGRSGHKLALSCANIIEATRKSLVSFFDAYDYERVIFTKNCTEALNMAIFGTLKAGDHVIATCMEHNSILRPLEFLQKNGLISYDICPLNESYNITPDAVKSLLRPNTKLVCITTASNVTGSCPPIASIKQILPDDVLLLCDGAQGGGHFPISMQKLGIDLLTFAGHKGLFAIQGSGGLLFSNRVELTPFMYGGTGSMSISLDMPDFYPDGLEAGTLSFPAIFSLLEGLNYTKEHSKKIQAKTYNLTKYCLERMRTFKNYKVFSQPNYCGIVAFLHKNFSSQYIAERLSTQYDIAVRGGLHCAPLMHQALGTFPDGLVRVSFSHFNTIGEIDKLIFALQGIDHND